MKRVKLHILISLLLLASSSLFSQSAYSNEIFRVLQVGAGKVMGEGPVSVTGNLFSVLYNPSLLDRNRGKEIGFVHTRQFLKDITYNYIGFGFNYTSYRISVAIARIGIDNIPDSRAARVVTGDDWGVDFSKVKQFNVADYFFLAGLRFPETYFGWNTGITLKIISRRYYISNAWGTAIDFGFHRYLFPNLLLGIKIENFLGSSLHWSTGKNEWIAPALAYGIRYQAGIFKDFTGTIVANVFHYFDNRGKSAQLAVGPASADFSMGTELEYKQFIQIRFGRDQNGEYSIGSTIFIPKIEVDYAFQKHSELGSTHNISLIFKLPY
jgi:hypothetical protein